MPQLPTSVVITDATGLTVVPPATETTLASALTELQSILAKLNASLAVTGSFYQVTQPVSAASLPLPTLAATSTNQATEITALQLLDDVVGTNGATAPTKVSMAGGKVNTSAPSYIDGYAQPLSMTTAGGLRVDGSAVTQPISDGGGTITVDNASLTALANAIITVEAGAGLGYGAFGLNVGVAVVEGTVLERIDGDASQLSLTIDGALRVRPAEVVTLGAATPTLAALVAGSDGTNARALKTDASGELQVDIVSMPPVSAATSADVLDADDDAGYTDGATGENLTQTPDGRLRTVVAGLVSDAAESYVSGTLRSLSLNSEGRLRVATVPAMIPEYAQIVPTFSSVSSASPWAVAAAGPWA